MAERIFLFTTSFPHGKAEQFLEPEIIQLSKNFKEVYLFPGSTEGEARKLPDNCKVIPLNVNFKLEKKFRHYLLTDLAKVFKYYFYLLFSSNNRGYYLKNFRKTIIDIS